MSEVHCWADKLEHIEATYGRCSREWSEELVSGDDGTCMLPDGHEGPHDFTGDDQIDVSFPDKETQ